jgi:hypothetical protein
MKKITIILIVLAIMLTACESLGVKPEGESITNASGITPSPDQAVLGIGAEPVIVFQRSGGFAGGAEQWSIYATGKITKRNGGELSIDPAQVTALLDAIQAAGFYDLTQSSIKGAISNCKDCYTYQLTINGEGKANTLTFQDGAKDVPEAFWNIIKKINEWIATPTKE